MTPLAFTAGATGCAAMQHEGGVSVGGYVSDRFTWSDGACAHRSAALVRNDASDPGGSRGGYLRQLVWNRAGTDITATGTGASGWNGWGYVVNHYGNTSDSSRGRLGTYSTPLNGAHHALHEFKVRVNPGGPVDATVRWFFATGRSNPVVSVSYDATPAGPNAVAADTRAPYGDLAFEARAAPSAEWSGATSPLHHHGRPTGDDGGYVGLHPAEHRAVRAHVVAEQRRRDGRRADAVLGAAPRGRRLRRRHARRQLLGQDQRHQGRRCSPSNWTMPQDWMWPFQLNQYELPYTNASHRLAWGGT